MVTDMSQAADALSKVSAAGPAQPSSSGAPGSAAGGTDPIVAVRAAEADVKAARGQFEALRPLVEPLLNVGGGLATLLGQQGSVDQLSGLWAFADSGIGAAEELLAAADAALEITSDGIGQPTSSEPAPAALLQQGNPTNDLARLVERVPELEQHLAAASADLDKAQVARQRIGTASELPSGVAGQIGGMLDRWDRLEPGLRQKLDAGQEWLNVLPPALGEDGPKTYLVLIQTSDELHATGGFITGVATITVTHGTVTGMGNFEVTKAKYTAQTWDQAVGVTGEWVQPPAPLSRYMGLGSWSLGDANWWADFPTTARQAARFWQAEKGMTVNGVIGVDEQGLAQLLAASGPLTVTGETITATNLKKVTLAHVFQGNTPAQTDSEGHAWATWAANQSAFTQSLASALIGALQQLPAARWPAAANHLAQAFEEHDLLFASFDPALASQLRELGADGALKGETDDWLYVVEQNVSYTKASPFIQQHLAYTVTLGADARPVDCQLDLAEVNNYTPDKALSEYPKGYYWGNVWNPSTRQLEGWEGYYGGYTRVYMPAGSQDLAASGFVDPPDIGTETGRAVVGGYLGLRMGAERHVAFAWTSGGQSSKPGTYRLVVQHQPGAPGQDLQITVLLPAGFQASRVEPAPERSTASSVSWHARADDDLSFSVTLAPIGADASGLSPVASGGMAEPPGSSPWAWLLWSPTESQAAATSPGGPANTGGGETAAVAVAGAPLGPPAAAASPAPVGSTPRPSAEGAPVTVTDAPAIAIAGETPNVATAGVPETQAGTPGLPAGGAPVTATNPPAVALVVETPTAATTGAPATAATGIPTIPPIVAPASSLAGAPTPPGMAAAPAQPAANGANTPPADPAWVSIPALGIQAPIVAVGLDQNGAMAAPQLAGEVAWYRLGPRPGETGNAVLAGHVDWYGKSGAFANLDQIAPGDMVQVGDDGGHIYLYMVREKQVYEAADAPVDQVFGQTADATLTLITCGGPYDATRGVYRDRIVVRAGLEQ
jgi:LPXTG-site transpeptidase (sortase) family protein